MSLVMFQFDYLDVSFAYKQGLSSSPSDQFDKHMHHFFELVYFLHGEVAFHVEEKVRYMQKGDVAFIKPGQYHFAEVNDMDDYVRFVCKIPPTILDKSLLEDLSSYPSFFADCSKLEHLLLELDDFASSFDPMRMRALCIGRCIEFLLRLNQKAQAPSQRKLSPLNEKVVSYIESHLNEDITYASLSSYFHYSPSYLERLFQKEMKVGLKEYIRGKKMMEARKLLEKGMKANEVALTLGYNDYSTFYRNYIKVFQSKPGQA